MRSGRKRKPVNTEEQKKIKLKKMDKLVEEEKKSKQRVNRLLEYIKW